MAQGLTDLNDGPASVGDYPQPKHEMGNTSIVQSNLTRYWENVKVSSGLKVLL